VDGRSVAQAMSRAAAVPTVGPMSSTSDATRVSDDDRDRVAAVLRDAVGRGQLSLAEVDERLRAAYAAVTRADLAAVTADLPQATPPRPSSGTARTPATQAAAKSAEWRSWVGVSLLLVGIWAATSLAAGHALFFWPGIPMAIWALSMVAGATGVKPGHCHGSVSAHRP
jgi:Domain of unknown function (DUF1707)